MSTAAATSSATPASSASVELTTGVEDGKREPEHVHVEVARIVLTASLERGDRVRERLAVEDGDEVAGLLNRLSR